MVRLADKHGAERLEAACRRALTSATRLQDGGGILVAGTEHDGDNGVGARLRAGASARAPAPVQR